MTPTNRMSVKGFLGVNSWSPSDITGNGRSTKVHLLDFDLKLRSDINESIIRIYCEDYCKSTRKIVRVPNHKSAHLSAQ